MKSKLRDGSDEYAEPAAGLEECPNSLALLVRLFSDERHCADDEATELGNGNADGSLRNLVPSSPSERRRPRSCEEVGGASIVGNDEDDSDDDDEAEGDKEEPNEAGFMSVSCILTERALLLRWKGGAGSSPATQVEAADDVEEDMAAAVPRYISSSILSTSFLFFESPLLPSLSLCSVTFS